MSSSSSIADTGASSAGSSRARLLPISGIGVHDSFLIIAPPGNPVISLDARLLDRIELIGRSPALPLVTSAAAVAGVVGMAVSSVPGGVFIGVPLAYISYSRLNEARRRARSRDLLLVLGELEVALHVADGADAAKRIADRLAPFTREAPITRPEVYEDARRRLEAEAAGTRSARAARELSRGLVVGEDAVRVEEGYLKVGGVSFRIDEVRDYAVRGANLPLPGGRLLQAAMGLLVVAAEQRARVGEDIEALRERVARYEEWSGRSRI